MPIYEFACGACGKRFDRLQKLNDPDPEICPHCGKAEVHRCVTAPTFRLSGSGWYETDFKKDGDKKRNLAGREEAPKSGGEAPAKSEGAAKSDTAAGGKPKAESAPAPAPANNG
jgi:putative FmdB family regulatory protein